MNRPQPLSCDSIAPELKALADGELAIWRRLAVRRHLKNCPHCREEFAFMKNLTQNLETARQNAQNAPLDTDLRERILLQAPQIEPAQIALDLARKRRKTKKKLVLALGGAFLLALAVNSAFLSSSMSPPARDEAITVNRVTANGDGKSLPKQKGREKLRVQVLSNGPVSATKAPQAGAAGSVSSNQFSFATSGDETADNKTQAEQMVDQVSRSRRSLQNQQAGFRVNGGLYHLDGTNFAMADGHVKWLRGQTGNAVTSALPNPDSYLPQQRGSKIPAVLWRPTRSKPAPTASVPPRSTCAFRSKNSRFWSKKSALWAPCAPKISTART